MQVSGVTASGMSLAVWVNLDCVIPQNYSYLAGDSVALTLPSSAATRFHIMVYGTTDPFNLLVTCGVLHPALPPPSRLQPAVGKLAYPYARTHPNQHSMFIARDQTNPPGKSPAHI